MPDRFEHTASGLDAPASHGFAVTPDDATALPETTRALYVGSAGDVAAILASGAEVTFRTVTAGSVLPVRVKAVKATGTTAGFILGLV